ncbi:MAG: VOC family protein [Bacteroidota bacterium]
MSAHIQPGQFVWHDLMSNTPEESTKFYQRIFGWDLEVAHMGEAIGDYTMFKHDDTTIGGVVGLDPAHGVPSHWISYISVDDVDAACKSTEHAAGTVAVPPFDIPNVGRTAVLADPTGAYFSPYTETSDESFTPPAPAVGLFNWHELMSTDIEKAKSYYTALVGWSIGSMEMQDPPDTYWMFQHGDQPVAGAIQMPAAAGEDAVSNWLPYIGVANVPESAKKTKELGGTIHVPPTHMREPSTVHFAVLGAPDGSMFGIVEV